MADEKKLELVTDEADPMEVAREKAEEIRRMYEARDEKATGAKEHLIAQLQVTSEKYLTANGVMQALCTLRDVMGDDVEMGIDAKIDMAKRMAKGMSNTALQMAARARDKEPEDLGTLCDVFYDADFTEGGGSYQELAEELMAISLCQQVGPSAQDVEDFIAKADEEIAAAREQLREYCENSDVDFDEVCGE